MMYYFSQMLHFISSQTNKFFKIINKMAFSFSLTGGGQSSTSNITTEDLHWSSSDDDDDNDDDNAEEEDDASTMTARTNVIADSQKLQNQLLQMVQKRNEEMAQLIRQRNYELGPRVSADSKDRIALALDGQTPTVLDENIAVEVTSHEIGNEGFRWEAITKTFDTASSKHLVEYTHRYMPDDPAEKLSEWILTSRVRPVPPDQVVLSVAVGDRVEIKLAITANDDENSKAWRPATVISDENTEENTVIIHLDRSHVQYTVALEKETFRHRYEWTGQESNSRSSRVGNTWGWVRWPALKVHKSKKSKKRKRKRDDDSTGGAESNGSVKNSGSSERGAGDRGGGSGNGNGSKSKKSKLSLNTNTLSKSKSGTKKRKKKSGSSAWKKLAKFRGR
jgi:hypothetical protein